MKRLFISVVLLTLLVQLVAIFNAPDKSVFKYNNDGRTLPIKHAQLPASTTIISNDTIWYGDFIVNATANVVITNCNLTIVGGGVIVYGNLTVQNAIIHVERGAWAPTDFIFYANSNFTARGAFLVSSNFMSFQNSSKAVIDNSTLDIFIVGFGGYSVGNISNTKVQYEISAGVSSKVNAANITMLKPPWVEGKWGSLSVAGSAFLNVYNMSTQWFWVYDSANVNVSKVWTDWIHIEDSPNITLYDSAVFEYFDVYSEASIINIYRSTIGFIRRWAPYDPTKVRDLIFIYDSHVSKMRQYYRFYGEVVLNQTGAFGEYFQAIRLTNTTVTTLLNPVVVCQNKTKTTIRNMDIRWLYLYDQSQVQLWNSTTEATYIYGYEGFLIGYYTNTSLLGQVNGKITIDATQQAKTTLEIWTAGWVNFAISKTTSPGTSPLGRKASTGTYVNMTAVGTVHAAQIRIYYTDEDIASKHLDETTLKIYFWNSSIWMPCQTTSVNTIEKYAWANVTNLTIYTIIGEISAIHFYKLIWSHIYTLFIQNETDSTYARSNLPLPV